MRYRKGQIAYAPSGRWVPNPYADQCRYCGKRPELKIVGFFAKWLPANQHSLDDLTRAIVEVTFPFEFRCYESWGVAFYVKFVMPPSPEGMETSADVLAGHRFGPFQCFCEADLDISRWFERATGDDPNLANATPHQRAIIEG